MYSKIAVSLLQLSIFALSTSSYPTGSPSLLDISISEITHLLNEGSITSRTLVDLYVRRTKEVNEALHAVIELNPDASAIAAKLDEERAQGHVRGPLHGKPLLVKDNIATSDVTATGSGSTCLADARPKRDSTVVERLRKAGAIILGKTNLSEFAGARGVNPLEGWSARGSQTFAAYIEHQTPCGSSSGSGVAASLGLAAGTLGTDTAGSITCPAAYSNVVGIKPTVGLTSRRGTVPITRRQDTIGPLAQNVADGALILEAIAGKDASDNYTSAQPWASPPSYLASLNKTALKGKRIGVTFTEELVGVLDPEIARPVFDAAVSDLEKAGAVIFPVPLGTGGFALDDLHTWIYGNISAFVFSDYHDNMAAYLNDTIPGPKDIETFEDLYECLQQDSAEQYPFYDIDLIAAAVGTGVPADGSVAWNGYVTAIRLAEKVILQPIEDNELDALVTTSDVAGFYTAPLGYPVVTVPIGALPKGANTTSDSTGTLARSGPGLPLGMSFIADRWTEEKLIGYAYAYEQVSLKRRTLTPLVKPASDLESVL
ncbi:amidase signature domain-containing protein [Xylariaceae sp. FL1019]|nr:amidase signature domain-containing protein [Xylariaceae sp. FL1019]